MDEIHELYNSLNRHYLEKNHKDEVYYRYVNELYQLIYDLEVFDDEIKSKLLDEGFSKTIKDCIVQYLNDENNIGNQFVLRTKKKPGEIQKKIEYALDILEEYMTDEYICLYNNGFYEYRLDIRTIPLDGSEGVPVQKKKNYEIYTKKRYEMDDRESFIKALVNQGIKKYIAKKIAYNLEKLRLKF